MGKTDNRYIILKYLIDNKCNVTVCSINDVLKTLDLTPNHICDALQIMEIDKLLRIIPRNHFQFQSQTDHKSKPLDTTPIMALITPEGEKFFKEHYKNQRSSTVIVILKWILIPLFVSIIGGIVVWYLTTP